MPSDGASDPAEDIISGVLALEYKVKLSRSTSGELHVRTEADRDGELQTEEGENGEGGTNPKAMCNTDEARESTEASDGSFAWTHSPSSISSGRTLSGPRISASFQDNPGGGVESSNVLLLQSLPLILDNLG